jgi:hypothetical protein
MTFGDASYWDDVFQWQLVPYVIDFIITTWKHMPKPESSEYENKISDSLYVALLRGKQRNASPFLIRREDLEFDIDLEKQTGRKDIVFYPSSDEDIYLCLEAKRLNAVISGIRRSLAKEYVIDGMQRFVDAKYARHVRHGAMLAYVLDGDIDSAIRDVERNVRERLTELRMEGNGFTNSSVRPDDLHTKETCHQRAHETVIFRIHHLFLAHEG